MTAEARKRQIVEVTLDLIAKHGLRGATMARIAAGTGIRQASLYTHFENRRAILLAALDVVYEKIFASRDTPSDENSLERLRQMCDHHLELWAAQGEKHHAVQLMEFVSGARSEGLAEILAEKHTASIEQYAQVVRDGQKEGKIPEYVDPDQVAWLITGWAFAGDVSHLMGFTRFLDPAISVHWLNIIFGSFEAGPSTPSA
ncbi:MAG: TetR/AcrR family transcriptional regulator [Actinobacteria bacterium]|jgi:AcrR family transcriptional regulator|nr:TetR/AcrR family transcriptional regulator [Actinomycetota bacterium]